MPKIKFSHEYNKLGIYTGQPVFTATLLEVLVVELSSLSKEFIKYDTEDKYPLPSSGLYMMLIFLKPGRINVDTTDLFTTMRRQSCEKEKFYRDNIGKTFDIEII
jgi:hypothetical protein